MTLYACTTSATLEDAVAAAVTHLGERAPRTAMLSSPRAFRFALLDDGALCGPGGEEVPLTEVFEARLFGEEAELRWLAQPDGSGRAVMLTEADSEPLSGWRPLTAIEPLDVISQTAILWGTAAPSLDPGPGWTALSEARIGKLDVPLAAVEERAYVEAVSREYLAEADQHGNVAVVEERLLRLRQEGAQ